MLFRLDRSLLEYNFYFQEAFLLQIFRVELAFSLAGELTLLQLVIYLPSGPLLGLSDE